MQSFTGTCFKLRGSIYHSSDKDLLTGRTRDIVQVFHFPVISFLFHRHVLKTSLSLVPLFFSTYRLWRALIKSMGSGRSKWKISSEKIERYKSSFRRAFDEGLCIPLVALISCPLTKGVRYNCQNVICCLSRGMIERFVFLFGREWKKHHYISRFTSFRLTIIPPSIRRVIVIL